MDYSPPESQKTAIYDKKAWPIAHENHEKSVIFDQNAWTITHQNRKKALFLTKMHGL